MHPATHKAPLPEGVKDSPRSSSNRDRGARKEAPPGFPTTPFRKAVACNVIPRSESGRSDPAKGSIEAAGTEKGKAKADENQKVVTKEKDQKKNRKKQDEKGQPGAPASSSSKTSPRPKRKAGDLSVVIFNFIRSRGLKDWGLFFRSSRDKGTVTLINWSMTHYKHEERFNVDPTEDPRFEQEIFVGPVDPGDDALSYENRVKKTKLQRSNNWNSQDWVLDVLERLRIHNNIEEDKYLQAVLRLRKMKQDAYSTKRS